MSVPVNYYPISSKDMKKYVYAVCSCPVPEGYYHRKKRIKGKARYFFHCNKCGQDMEVDVFNGD